MKKEIIFKNVSARFPIFSGNILAEKSAYNEVS